MDNDAPTLHIRHCCYEGMTMLAETELVYLILVADLFEGFDVAR